MMNFGDMLIVLFALFLMAVSLGLIGHAIVGEVRHRLVASQPSRRVEDRQ